jgi:hypothetical protein
MTEKDLEKMQDAVVAVRRLDEVLSVQVRGTITELHTPGKKRSREYAFIDTELLDDALKCYRNYLAGWLAGMGYTGPEAEACGGVSSVRGWKREETK